VSRIGISRKLSGRPRYAKARVANLPKVVKPASAEKKRTEAFAGLSGVVRDSAHAKID
jgi:hypothetical protein